MKLTEVELFFLSEHVTKNSACDWLVVYLGIGNGDRFRLFRDQFFPGLAVVGFDPLDEYLCLQNEGTKNAARWNDDGTSYTLHVRCFDMEQDVARIHELLENGKKRLLLISDIRGARFREDWETWDIAYDQELQWQIIKRLQPVASLVKFSIPDPDAQFYEYAPGVILKQAYCNYETCEVRLMIEGVPQESRRYNAWELYEKMLFHHKYLRGQVYQTSREPGRAACLDCCFDCTVLWSTVLKYATRNDADPYDVLDCILRQHIYSPEWGFDKPGIEKPLEVTTAPLTGRRRSRSWNGPYAMEG
jgi:hypothetical protein